MKRLLCGGLLLTLSVAAAAAEMIGELRLQSLLDEQTDYVLLDARSDAARNTAPLPLAKRYAPGMFLHSDLVLVVADDDAAALTIANSVPVAAGRTIHAVAGGAEVWLRASRQSVQAPKADFNIPSGTCKPGIPLHEFKEAPAPQREKR
ncbi:hypothetical protein UT4_06810 [Ferrigenium sp. UT4]